MTHKSPDNDLHGDQIFTLAGMKLTLDCNKMWYLRPTQFIETKLSCQNPTLSTTGKGWNVKDHFNWFDKTIDITKFKGNPPTMFGRKLKKTTGGIRKRLDQQNISKSTLGF